MDVEILQSSEGNPKLSVNEYLYCTVTDFLRGVAHNIRWAPVNRVAANCVTYWSSTKFPGVKSTTFPGVIGSVIFRICVT